MQVCLFSMHTGKTLKGKEHGTLRTHELSSAHKDAMMALSSYRKSKETGSVLSQLSSSYDRCYIKTIAEIILFCAMPLRGHSERADGDSVSRGVFLDFVDLVARHDSCFNEKLKSIPINAKYQSSVIQNEILNILSQMVLSMITKQA